MEEEQTKKKKSISTWPIVVLIIVALAILLAVLIIQMKGSTSTSGTFPDPETTESFTCINNNEVMSIIDPRNAVSKSTKMTATFNKDKLDTISISYSLGYTTAEDIRDSANVNHVIMNKSTQEEGLGADIFNLRFNQLSDSLEIRMYAESNQITNVSAKYLMLDKTAGSYSKSSIKSNYTSQGFRCS